MAPSRISPPPSTASPPPPFLTPKQLSTFHRDGYLLIPSYLTPAQCTTLLATTHSLLTEFPLSSHPMTKFTTDASDHVGDEYFLTSGDKVRFFFETEAFSPTTNTLTKPKELAINKIGHSLHTLVPEFSTISHRGQLGRQNTSIAMQIGFKDPRLLQSMVICKQPEIGGAVPPHQDSTFLYTRQPSAVGFWIALEDATESNGCLSFAPGSHRRAPIRERFVRHPDGPGTGFDKIVSEKEQWPRDFDHETEMEEEYVLGEVKAGTLVLIHGNLLHKSEKNVSSKGRMIYTFHVIEGEEEYDEKNWLQIPGGPEAFTRLDGSEA